MYGSGWYADALREGHPEVLWEGKVSSVTLVSGNKLN